MNKRFYLDVHYVTSDHDNKIMFFRTRDPALLDTCDIIVDVGGIYDPHKLRFDHHQR